MANKKYEETDVQAIAEAIREKTGSEDSYKVSDMASGVNEVYEAGKKAEYDAFWDNVNLGKIKNCASFSGDSWNDDNFKPPSDIVWDRNSAQWSFARNNITNLKACLERQNVTLDLSKATDFAYIFNNSPSTQLPELNFTGAAANRPLINIAGSMVNLVSVDKIILPDEYTPSSNREIQIFPYASKLQYINIEGTILYSWVLSASPLSVESLKSIITHLKDYAGTTSEYTYTVTFKTSAFEALEAEGATAEYNGVACTWAELIDNLKWNLVKA